ncbi:MAG: hypothetical protein Q8900_02465 [Bacillota bacterium]|nr:hypothetical protein [Bacillota bacterium]
MKQLSYCISELTSEQDKSFFMEMIPYVSEQVVSAQRMVDVIIIECVENSRQEEVLRKLDLLKELSGSKSIGNTDNITTKIILDKRDVETINNSPIMDLLIESGSAVEVDKGMYGYSGIFLNVLNYFYLKVKEFSKQVFKANEFKFPILFPIKSFEQGGYFETFPHHIMFQTILKSDIEVLNEFSKEKADKEKILLNNMSRARHVIKNAACGPIYPSLEGKKIDVDEAPLVYFVMDKCFREEASNVFELARLNEFSMAEIVFLGTDAQVRNGIGQARQLWDFWLECFGLNCVIETANDSFFAGNYKKLKLFQLLGDAKLEYRLLLPHNSNYIASSSINFHRTHFSKKYNITTHEGYCQTACIAFGLERLAYAFLCQKGINPEAWDEGSKNEIGKYVDIHN